MLFHRLTAILVPSCLLFALGSGTTRAQSGSTVAPGSPPFIYPPQAFYHTNTMGAVGGIAGVAAHLKTVHTYWGELDRFNGAYNQERSELQAQANWSNQMACRDYKATVRTDTPGGTPSSIRLEASVPYPVMSAATGKAVDSRSPAGARMEWDYLHNTRIGYRTLCELPSGAMVPPTVAGVSSLPTTISSRSFTGSSASLPFYAPSVQIPSLMSTPTRAFDAGSYSLGVDYGSIGRQNADWSRRMEAQYPWLKR